MCYTFCGSKNIIFWNSRNPTKLKKQIVNQFGLLARRKDKVEATETVRDQFQSPVQAPVSTSGLPNQIITTTNCSSVVINNVYQVSKMIGLETKTSIGSLANINSGICR